MARAIWSGAISFGLVNVPVKLYSAVSRKTVRFNQLSATSGARIQQKRVDPTTGEEVAYEDVVKGYELSKDRYVTVTSDELEALDPERTRTVDLERFVALADIDPLLYDSGYLLGPDGSGSAKPYGLLRAAMHASGKVAIGRVVLRSKEYLVAIRPTETALVMHTLVFADEVNDPAHVDGLDAQVVEPTQSELAMAAQLIDSLTDEFDHALYRDEYREKVLALIEAKAAGEEFPAAPSPEQPAAVPDLMAALEASLAAVKDRDPGPAAASKPKDKPAKRTKRKPSKAKA